MLSHLLKIRFSAVPLLRLLLFDTISQVGRGGRRRAGTPCDVTDSVTLSDRYRGAQKDRGTAEGGRNRGGTAEGWVEWRTEGEYSERQYLRTKRWTNDA